MSKFKVGDKVIFLKKDESYEEGLTIGEDYVVCKLWHPHYGLVSSDGTLTYVSEDQIDFLNKYEDSNRFKLKQAIIDTGYSSRRLSHIAIGNESFFYNLTGKARFKEKGDISNESLEKLKAMVLKAQKDLTNKLTDYLIEERVENNLAPKTVDDIMPKIHTGEIDYPIDFNQSAKTVDENNIPVNIVDSGNIGIMDKPEITWGSYCLPVDKDGSILVDSSEYKKVSGEFTSGIEKAMKNEDSNKEDYYSYLEQIDREAIEKRDFKLNNFTIFFLILVVILAVYFFTK